MDAVGSNIRMDSKGWEVKRVLPRVNDEINEEWISDKTRYACDGLLNNRIDNPYIKKNGKLIEASWKEAINFIYENVSDKKSFAGLVGQLVDLETAYAFKSFLKNTFNSDLIDFRQKDILFDTSDEFNFRFNTSIQKIDECDFILLIGANPRHEATIINTRIRKAVKNGCKVFSIGDPGELHYNYKVIGNNISILDDLINGNISESKILKEAKNPAIIIGESVLKPEVSLSVTNSVKALLKNINKLDGFNILHQSASSVGNLILGLQSNEIEKIYSSEVLYLLNADEIDPKKLKNKFVIYQGTHGGESSQIADVVLPGAAYSEKNGSFVNLEGRVQKSFKASYPPGFAKEDWEIFLEISNHKNINLGFDSFESLRELMLKEHSRLGNYDQLPETDLDTIKIDRHVKKDFKVDIDLIDYYQSNIIARASTTMSECKNSKTINKKTGTEN